jgi:disulfide bond formation protein DsbB
VTGRLLGYAAGAGSAALLVGAFAFQYMGGLPPCALCIWQRWPHAVAAIIAAVLMVAPPALRRPLLAIGALAALTTAAIGGYHAGIEQGWWSGPTSCTGSGPGLSGLSGTDLLDMTAPARVVMCDEIPWTFAGLSMAGWNAVASLGLAMIWLAALRVSAR